MDIDKMLSDYHGAICKVVNKYSVANPRFDREDVMEEGRLAAIKAANAFRPEEGVKFITYLTTTLNRELQKFVGANAYDLNVREKDRRRIGSETLRGEAIAIKTDAMPQHNGESFSYDIPGYYASSVQASGAIVDPEEELLAKERLEILREEIGKLPAREREVIESRYLGGQTLAELAEKFGTSNQAVFTWGKNGFELLKRRMKARLGDD
jgi:RNA polymerase sigma factor (sigma-70 family)